ncbi:MAG: IS630 transposase-related protein [Deinococcaceae bacterium]
MPVMYSLDFRQRIVGKYHEGYTIKEVEEIYNASSSSVVKCFKPDDNNDLAPKKEEPPRIDRADLENIRAMVQNMPDIIEIEAFIEEQFK